MGHVTDGLTFNTLRRGNLARLPMFKNCHGEPAHSEPDGSDWSDAEWLEAVVGELGEYANLAKKRRRGDITEKEFREAGGRELADVVIYLDILAFRIGVDLGRIVMTKWNDTSRKVGADIYLDAEDYHLGPPPISREQADKERAAEAGRQQMLADLYRLANQDGYIAAAWALEQLGETS